MCLLSSGNSTEPYVVTVFFKLLLGGFFFFFFGFLKTFLLQIKMYMEVN